MLRDVMFILRKELQFMLKSRETLMWVFLMPGLFMYFIGTVTGNASGGGRQDVLAMWTGDNPGFMADELRLRLEERDYKVVQVDSLHKLEAYSRRLSVPSNFTEMVLAGEVAQLDLERKSGGIGGDFDGFRVGRASYTLLADLIVSNSLDATPSAESFASLRETPRAVTLQVAPAGERQTTPSGFAQAIPGLMVMFTVMVMTTSGAVQLVVERRQGLLRRLAYTPIKRQSIVLGKWGGKLSLGLVQISFAMLIGTVLFKMDWGPNFGMVIVVMLAYAAAMASLGMLLGTVARTEGIAVGIGVVSSNVLAALGGCWWPIEITPEWMQKLQLFIPTGWAMDALHRLISFADTPASVLPHIAIMLIVAAVLLGMSTRAFRFQ